MPPAPTIAINTALMSAVEERKGVNYTETQAAEKLGISVDQLRNLVSSHIGCGEDGTRVSTFRPSDLVVLRILSAGAPLAAAATA
jgi:hypothetical protein